jgi:hypothetical protein
MVWRVVFRPKLTITIRAERQFFECRSCDLCIEPYRCFVFTALPADVNASGRDILPREKQEKRCKTCVFFVAADGLRTV